MAKRVLGNDPFQRGAAQRMPAPEAKPASTEAKAEPGGQDTKAASGAAKAPAAKSGAEKRSASKAKPSAAKKSKAAGAQQPVKAGPSEVTEARAKAEPSATAPAKAEPSELTEARAKAEPSEPSATAPAKAEAPAALAPASEEPRPKAPPKTKAPEPSASAPPAPERLDATARAQVSGYSPSARPALRHPSEEPGLAERIRRFRPKQASAAAGLSPDLSGGPERRTDGLGERARSVVAALRAQLEPMLGGERFGRVKDSVTALVEALLASVGARSGHELDEFGQDAQLRTRVQPLVDFLYDEYWRVTVQDARNVPTGAAILVANHSGALPFDGPMLQQALLRERPELREPRWLVEDQIFYAPFLGTLYNRLGAIRASPENALRLLEQQRPTLVFPEGVQGIGKPFGERYKLKRFGRGGFVKLAMRTGAPIVPVAIVGAEEAAPLLGKLPGRIFGLPYLPITPLGPLPLPSKWVIRFGEPITVSGRDPENLSEVQRVADQTREAIQSLLHAMLRDRRTVFSG